MVSLYNIDDIKLGPCTYLGHENYVYAEYKPVDSNNSYKIVVKKNKYNQAEHSYLEVGLSQLAQLFLAKNLTSPQKLVVNSKGRVLGVATENLCYSINRREGNDATYYTINSQDSTLSSRPFTQVEHIPYTFFDQVPHGFFVKLLDEEKNNILDIDYNSLASILASSYTLEEDDLHKGNFGFYIVKKNGKPRVVFFKIDHDLMFAESIMSFKTPRLIHLFNHANAFGITTQELIEFPNLFTSSNVYWPTRYNLFGKPRDNKAFLVAEEIKAFSHLCLNPAFNKAKWLAFYKHIVLPQVLIEEELKKQLNEYDAQNRAKIALLSAATMARQACLRAALFSIKEFRDTLVHMSPEEHKALLDDISPNTSELETQVKEAMLWHNEFLKDDVFEEGDTPLHIAIKLGEYRYEETLQMFGSFMNVKNKAGKTPLDVAMEMMHKIPDPSQDIRKDVRFTLKHLVANGAEKNTRFELFYRKEIESYRFKSTFFNLAAKATSYKELKSVLRELSEDHRFSLKSKKNLAIECVEQFIKSNGNNPYMVPILRHLKKDIQGESSKEHAAPLLFIRQLRSRLWIIRLIRGLYGQTSTQVAMNTIIDTELERIQAKQATHLTFFQKAEKKEKPQREKEEHSPLRPPK